MTGSVPVSQATWQIAGRSWELGDRGPLHVAVLFADMVSSTEFASVLTLEDYAALGETFETTCRETCLSFFGAKPEKFLPEQAYSFQVIGDELVVFLHTDRPHDDVYQLVCLSIALKTAWLGVPHNAERIASGRPSCELAVGVHSGPVWATRGADGFRLSGFAINLAKRLESASRHGDRFRIFVSDPAFKLVNRRMRNLIFGPRELVELKGVGTPFGVYELVESFVDPVRRLPLELGKRFMNVARAALATNSFDLWIHSCLQVAEGARNELVSDECLELCHRVLSIDPQNAVALYYAAEAEVERGELGAARLYLDDLTRYWPTLGDGWLALGRLQNRSDDQAGARRSLLQARRYGVDVGQEELPDGDPA